MLGKRGAFTRTGIKMWDAVEIDAGKGFAEDKAGKGFVEDEADDEAGTGGERSRPPPRARRRLRRACCLAWFVEVRNPRRIGAKSVTRMQVTGKREPVAERHLERS